MATKYEIRVRPVTRYIVTEWHQECHENGMASAGGSLVLGEYENQATARHVGEALHALRVSERAGDVAPLAWLPLEDAPAVQPDA